MTKTNSITRPPKEMIEALKDIGAATVAGTLGHMGFRNPHMLGPVAQTKGKSIVGPAVTLQCLPQRPDLFSEGEYADPETQLHRHVLYEVEAGDVVVVDARGDMSSGIFGDSDCTPGYYNLEGQAGGRATKLNAAGYPQGPAAFFTFIDGWRRSGRFEGLAFRSAADRPG